MVSRKPLITVSGVRNSWDTLATKAVRVALSCSAALMSWVISNSARASKVERVSASTRWRCLPLGTLILMLRGAASSGCCKNWWNSGMRSKLGKMPIQSRSTSRFKCVAAKRFIHSIRPSRLRIITPLGMASAARLKRCKARLSFCLRFLRLLACINRVLNTSSHTPKPSGAMRSLGLCSQRSNLAM